MRGWRKTSTGLTCCGARRYTTTQLQRHLPLMTTDKVRPCRCGEGEPVGTLPKADTGTVVQTEEEQLLLELLVVAHQLIKQRTTETPKKNRTIKRNLPDFPTHTTPLYTFPPLTLSYAASCQWPTHPPPSPPPSAPSHPVHRASSRQSHHRTLLHRRLPPTSCPWQPWQR